MPYVRRHRPRTIPWDFSPLPKAVVGVADFGHPKALAVLAAIAGEINFSKWNKTYYARLTSEELRSKAGVGSARTLLRIVKMLAADGYITTENHRRGGVLYRFNPNYHATPE